MTNGPCEMEYKRGLAKRREYPLDTGGYKIRETARLVNRQIDAINRIAAWKQGYQDNSFYRCCTSSDCHTWLKKLPAHLAWLMGYNIRHAILALGGDGVSKQDITVLENFFKPQIEEFVEYCDEVRERYRKNISLEYHNMKNGGSEFRELNFEALFIANGILDVIPEECR